MIVRLLLCIGIAMNAISAIAQSGNDGGKAWFPLPPVVLPQIAPTPSGSAPLFAPPWQPSIDALELEAAESARRYQDSQNRIPRNQLPSYPMYQQQNVDIGSPPRKEDGFRYFLAGRYFWRAENGYPRDIAIAVVLLRKSAQADYPPAIYQLGKLYLQGLGVPMNESAGIELMRRAQRLGLSDNEAELRKNGLMY